MDGTNSTLSSASPIKDATLHCLNGFNVVLGSSDEKHKAKAEDNLTRFRIWAGNIGAFHGLPSRASADFRLREAPEVRARIIELLDEINETCDELCTLSSDDVQDTEAEDDFDVAEDLCLSISDSITSLLKVSALLRKATTRDRYAQALASKHDALPHEYSVFDRRHVAEKFPKLQQQQWLCDRLADAITMRRRYLRYAQRHQRRIAHEQVDVKQLITNPIQLAPSQAQKSSSAPKTHTTKVLSTAASTLQVQKLAELNLDQLDVEDDDNISQATSYVSEAGLDDEDRSNVIELDKLSKRGEPFECPYCRGMVHFKNQRAWRKHVFRDLRAYVCTFPDCDAGLFEDRHSWFTHELECHRRLLVCLACSNKVFHDVETFRAHLKKAHSDKYPLASESVINASSRPVAEIPADSCPMCEDWSSRLQTGLSDPGTITVPPNRFKQHLSTHQEQLALFSITPNFDRELDSEDASQKSGVSVHNRQERLLGWQDNVESRSEEDSDPSERGDMPTSSHEPFADKMQLASKFGPFVCMCCPKRPKKFDTEEDLRSHEAERQYTCSYCPNRFKNKDEADRHMNSLHLRRHSWSCAALSGIESIFYDTSTGSDMCGYCGQDFPKPPNWDARTKHVTDAHNFGECNVSKKFYSNDHFQQHLKHSHNATKGIWTELLEKAGMREEIPTGTSGDQQTHDLSTVREDDPVLTPLDGSHLRMIDAQLLTDVPNIDALPGGIFGHLKARIHDVLQNNTYKDPIFENNLLQYCSKLDALDRTASKESDRTPRSLVQSFYFIADHELRNNHSFEEGIWASLLDRHLSQFVVIFASVLDEQHWSKNNSELMKRLKILETNFLGREKAQWPTFFNPDEAGQDQALSHAANSSIADITHITSEKRPRVKIYELKNNDWYDRGTGWCEVRQSDTGNSSVEGRGATIIVTSEQNPDLLLLETRISIDNAYEKQQDTLIVWTETNSVDMALSFQEAEGCANIWDIISDVQLQMKAAQEPTGHGSIDRLLDEFWLLPVDIALVGLRNAGKTSLLRVLSGDERYINERYIEIGPTLGVYARRAKKWNGTVECWDIGPDSISLLANSPFASDMNAIVFVIDSADRDSMSKARQELYILLENVILQDIPILVLGNKIDLSDHVDVAEIVAGLGLNSVANRQVGYLNISAKQKTNLDLALSWLIARRSRTKSPETDRPQEIDLESERHDIAQSDNAKADGSTLSAAAILVRQSSPVEEPEASNRSNAITVGEDSRKLGDQTSELRPPPAYRCGYSSCMEQFESDIELSRHILEVHNPNNAQMVACRYPGCYQSFLAKEAMVEHMHRDHNSTVPKLSPTLSFSADKPTGESDALPKQETYDDIATESIPRQLGPNQDEYSVMKTDPNGEKKLAKYGHLLGGRRYRCNTFPLQYRGEHLFMLASECATVLGYPDASTLFNTNESLYRIVANTMEKDELFWRHKAISDPDRSRDIELVTARSVFRLFGHHIVEDGKPIVDDYWEAAALRQGDTEQSAGSKTQDGNNFVGQQDEAGTYKPGIPPIHQQHVSDKSDDIGLRSNLPLPEISMGMSNEEVDQSAAKFYCYYEPCASESKWFGQQSELESHFQAVHARTTTQLIDCEYAGCHRRAENGFARRDELHEHMREVHKCCICHKAAEIRCLGCDGDLYCESCHYETHSNGPGQKADHELVLCSRVQSTQPDGSGNLFVGNGGTEAISQTSIQAAKEPLGSHLIANETEQQIDSLRTRLHPPKPNLRDILSNTAKAPWTLSAFMEYMSNNHCLEPLEFTMDAARYKKHYAKMYKRAADGTPSAKDREYVKQLWKRLVDAYIVPNGAREVNLPLEVRDSILMLSTWTENPDVADVEVPLPPNPETLDPAVTAVYELLEESVLVPFLNSLEPETAPPASADPMSLPPVIPSHLDEGRPERDVQRDASNEADEPASKRLRDSASTATLASSLLPHIARGDYERASAHAPMSLPAETSFIGRRSAREEADEGGSRPAVETTTPQRLVTPTETTEGNDQRQFPCVFHNSENPELDFTSDCRQLRRYVSELRVHHATSAHRFFYCAGCITRFADRAGREDHFRAGGCQNIRCVTEKCPNFGTFSKATCNHDGKGRQNSQRSIWNALRRLAYAPGNALGPGQVADEAEYPPLPPPTRRKIVWEHDLDFKQTPMSMPPSPPQPHTDDSKSGSQQQTQLASQVGDTDTARPPSIITSLTESSDDEYGDTPSSSTARRTVGGADLYNAVSECMKTFQRVEVPEERGKEYQNFALKLAILQLRIARWYHCMTADIRGQQKLSIYSYQDPTLVINVLRKIEEYIESTENDDLRQNDAFALQNASDPDEAFLTRTLALSIKRIAHNRVKGKSGLGTKSSWILLNPHVFSRLLEDIRDDIADLEDVSVTRKPLGAILRLSAQQESQGLWDSLGASDSKSEFSYLRILESATNGIDEVFLHAIRATAKDVDNDKVGEANTASAGVALDDDNDNTERQESRTLDPTEASQEATAGSAAAHKRGKNIQDCTNCRMLHIRCGREEPSCENCVANSRRCEGYAQLEYFKPRPDVEEGQRLEDDDQTDSAEEEEWADDSDFEQHHVPERPQDESTSALHLKPLDMTAPQLVHSTAQAYRSDKMEPMEPLESPPWKGGRFEAVPTEGASRPLTSTEAWSLYHYETHARQCKACYDSTSHPKSTLTLCETGSALALDVWEHVRFRDGAIYSTKQEDREEAAMEVEAPPNYDQVIKLLKAQAEIESDLSKPFLPTHRRTGSASTPFLRMRYYDATENVFIGLNTGDNFVIEPSTTEARTAKWLGKSNRYQAVNVIDDDDVEPVPPTPLRHKPKIAGRSQRDSLYETVEGRERMPYIVEVREPPRRSSRSRERQREERRK